MTEPRKGSSSSTMRMFFVFSADNIRDYVIKNIETFLEGDDIGQAVLLIDLMSRFSSAALSLQVLFSIQCFGELDNNDSRENGTC